MTPPRLSAADARRLGLAPAKAKRTRRRVEPYHTACTECDEHFTTRAAETRHLNSTGHTQYQMVLDL